MNISILVFGSDHFLTELPDQIYEKTTFNLEANANLNQAVSLIQATPPDIVLIQASLDGSMELCSWLKEQTKLSLENKEINSKNFTKQISFNLIPHIDVFSDDGYTKEELKMTNETKKILDPNIELSATCVRVPVLVSHSEAINLELEKDFTIDQIRECLENMEGCKVIDERKDGGYSTPFEAAGKDETFISRIREDKTKKNCLNMWVVSDNLLRGAALNAVEIAETLIKNNFYGK